MKVVKAMDCKACRNEIEDARHGERPSAEALAHMESCARCRIFGEERNALRELISSLQGEVSAPTDFDWRLRARLAADKGHARRFGFRHGYAPGLPAIGLAASFVLLIAAAALFKQADVRMTPSPVELASAPAKNVADTPTNSDTGKLSEVNTAAPPIGEAVISSTKTTTGGRLHVARAAQSGRSSRSEQRAPELTAAATTVNPSLHSNDFSSSAAPVVSLFSIPVRTPAQPLRVLLDEGRGTMRTVALQSVTFGSQKILEHRWTAASGPDTSAEEVW
jgi:hypothetical protein